MEGGAEKGPRFAEEPDLVFTLGSAEEAALWEPAGDHLLQSGVVLEDRPSEVARLHQVIRVEGDRGLYTAEVVAINRASDNDPKKCRYVLEILKRPA